MMSIQELNGWVMNLLLSTRRVQDVTSPQASRPKLLDNLNWCWIKGLFLCIGKQVS